MSKFGMKIGDETVHGIVSPDHALDLISKVVEQYFGEYWTQHKPRCPLCDTALSDTEKHMNRPVGECTSPSCDSTIHIADFFGKIKDVLGEWTEVKDEWMDKVKLELRKKSATSNTGFVPSSRDDTGTDASEYSQDDLALSLVGEDTVFVW